MRYIPRSIGLRFREYLKTFPAVMVWGPRQCGKSTFVAHQLPHFEHFDLERPADYNLISADPELFLTEHGDRICIDEAQRYPELFPVMRHIIDKRRQNGRFVLLGSSGPILLRKMSETLAGRIGILELTPFTVEELSSYCSWDTRWWRGGLPPLYDLDTEEQRIAWLQSYLQALLERELPVAGVRVPARRLLRFWTMLSYVHGQLLNVSTLARSLELSSTAISHYLDILEGVLLIRRLQPYYVNIRKRLVKSPKVYIRDSGILHWLAGLTDEGSLEKWPNRGNSFEGLVVEELIIAATNSMRGAHFTFYRTQAGAEVDLLVQSGQKIWPIEIKLGIDVRHYDTVGLRRCMEDLNLEQGFVITRGESIRSLGRGIYTLPWEKIAAGKLHPWSDQATTAK
jgi:predicted AAA+ superfamily ATPase